MCIDKCWITEKMPQTVYVLKQKQGKTYVGISGDFDSRLDQHQSGEGAEWTKKYQVIAVEHTETVPNLEIAKQRERHLTLKLMKERGINNVRGGGYTQSMNYDTSGIIKQTVNEYYKEFVKPRRVTCWKCGTLGHYANTCNYTRVYNYKDKYPTKIKKKTYQYD
jgi:predicted GIY-YIG superfamily endonuclease